MSNLAGCCCGDAKGYYILQPCHLSAVTTKYMSASDWAGCGFNYATVYKNGYCGYWRPSATVGDTLDNTCSNYTANSAGCCGSGFDPCPDIPLCCGYQECMEYREANSQPVPLNVTGYLANTGSAGSSWTASVTSVSIGTPAFYDPGTADFRYLVTGTILVTFTADASNIDCDGSARPPARTVPFEFYMTHDWIGPSCFDTKTTDSTTDPCDYSVAVCPGTTTSGGGTGYTACDILAAEPQSGQASMSSPFPVFDNDCTPPNSNYRVAVAIGIDLITTDPLVDDCVPGCGGSAWADKYFPDVNATVTLTLAGVWQ